MKRIWVVILTIGVFGALLAPNITFAKQVQAECVFASKFKHANEDVICSAVISALEKKLARSAIISAADKSIKTDLPLYKTTITNVSQTTIAGKLEYMNGQSEELQFVNSNQTVLLDFKNLELLAEKFAKNLVKEIQE